MSNKDADVALFEWVFTIIGGAISLLVTGVITAIMVIISGWKGGTQLTEEDKLLRAKPEYSLGDDIKGVVCPNCQTLNEKSVVGGRCYNCGVVVAKRHMKTLTPSFQESLAEVPLGVWAIGLMFLMVLFCVGLFMFCSLWWFGTVLAGPRWIQ